MNIYKETIAAMSGASVKKASFARNETLKYLILSLFAGIYVGFGIILIFTIGAPVAEAGSPFLKALMGASFGIALSLVVVAGAELFTGNNMIMVIGNMEGKSSVSDTAIVWTVSYIGNLIGSLLLAWLCVQTGFFKSGPLFEFMAKVAKSKMTAPGFELFVRGVLCNMLVCLAVWMSARVKEDIAKFVAIFWCLFAFIACGYEHSVANMSLMAMPLFAGAGESVTWAGYARNLVYVSIGNIVGGSIMIGAAYAYVSRGRTD